MSILSNKQPEPKTLAEAIKQIDALWEIVKTVEVLAKRVEQLEQENAQLRRQLEDRRQSSSSNSSSPPSRDNDWQRQSRRERRARKNTGKPKGGQPGHQKYERSVVGPDEIDNVQYYYPDGICTHCHGPSMVIDEQPRHRHQVFDLPPGRCTVTEHQLFSAQCSACQHRQHAQTPDSVPSGQMGPGLIAAIGHLSGQYHLSIRQLQDLLREHWQLDFSIGAISQAQGKLNPMLDDLYQQVAELARKSDVAHADETRHWRNGEGRWLWTLCTEACVLFMTHYSRGKLAANQLLGSFSGILVSDRHGGYNDHPREKRQLCWAHIIRNVTYIAERDGSAGEIGKRLVLIAHAVFRVEHRRKKQPRAAWNYQRRINRLRRSWQATLQKGAAESMPKRTRNICKRLLADNDMLWTFTERDDVPLTNNKAEQALRPYVIWRKSSYSAQSAQGDQFRPQILTVLQTAKRWNLSGLKLLREVCTQATETGRVDFRFPFTSELPSK